MLAAQGEYNLNIEGRVENIQKQEVAGAAKSEKLQKQHKKNSLSTNWQSKNTKTITTTISGSPQEN